MFLRHPSHHLHPHVSEIFYSISRIDFEKLPFIFSEKCMRNVTVFGLSIISGPKLWLTVSDVCSYGCTEYSGKITYS